MKKLYTLDNWVQFPSSEYGGLIVLIAENDQEAFEILSDSDDVFHTNDYEKYGHLIMEYVLKANKFNLADDYESGIIDAFLT